MELKGEEEYMACCVASSQHSPETISFFTPSRQSDSSPPTDQYTPSCESSDDSMQVDRPRFKTRWQEVAESYFSVVLKIEPEVFDPMVDLHLVRLARLKQALEAGQRYYMSDEENKILLDIIFKFLTTLQL